MDPLTQGALGAALPLATRRGKPAAVAAGCGCLAGLAPDLDIVLRDPEDTLLFLELHRQFTHALIFIPVGSAIVAGALQKLEVCCYISPVLHLYLEPVNHTRLLGQNVTSADLSDCIAGRLEEVALQAFHHH